MASTAYATDVKITGLNAKAAGDVTMATDVVPMVYDAAGAGIETVKIPVADLVGKLYIPASDNNGKSISTQEAYGSIQICAGAGIWVLPAAKAGMNLCLYQTTTGVTKINPDGSETINNNGTSVGAGYTLDGPATANSYICLVVLADGEWTVFGGRNTWTKTAE